MVSKRLTSACLLSGFLISGCATIPAVTAEYRLAETTLQFRVTRTIGCSAGAAKELIIADTVTPVVTHRGGAAINAKKSLNLRAFSALWANGDIKFEVHPDGRLKSVNSTATGQAQPILDAAIKFATGTGGFKASMFENGCGDIHQGFADKTVTITFTTDPFTPQGSMTGDIPVEGIPLKPDPASERLYKKYGHYFDVFCVTNKKDVVRHEPIGKPDLPPGHIGLDARHPALVQYSIVQGGKINQNSSITCGDEAIWSATIPIAQAGTDYTIPIPNPPWFGKQTFAVAFDESGALATLQYAQESGAASSFSSALAAYEAGHTTNAERTAALKAETDLIAAQQKLVKCQADPASC